MYLDLTLVIHIIQYLLFTGGPHCNSPDPAASQQPGPFHHPSVRSKPALFGVNNLCQQHLCIHRHKKLEELSRMGSISGE